MKGWEMKPFGWLAVLALIVLGIFMGFRIRKRLNPPSAV
jgi:hypothetical protein